MFDDEFFHQFVTIRKPYHAQLYYSEMSPIQLSAARDLARWTHTRLQKMVSERSDDVVLDPGEEGQETIATFLLDNGIWASWTRGQTSFHLSGDVVFVYNGMENPEIYFMSPGKMEFVFDRLRRRFVLDELATLQPGTQM